MSAFVRDSLIIRLNYLLNLLEFRVDDWNVCKISMDYEILETLSWSTPDKFDAAISDFFFAIWYNCLLDAIW